jgi:hypothetical protein
MKEGLCTRRYDPIRPVLNFKKELNGRDHLELRDTDDIILKWALEL